jgi:hypothetical protein
MRNYGFLGSLMALAGVSAAANFPITMIPFADYSQPKRRRTGKTHTQHCGARQTARYTRQLAAGQISFIKHGPRAA